VTFVQPLPIDSHHFCFRYIGKPAAQPVEKQLPTEFRELKGLPKPLVGRQQAKRLKIHSMVRTWFHVRLPDRTCYHIRIRISRPKFPFHECVYWWAKQDLNLRPPALQTAFREAGRGGGRAFPRASSEIVKGLSKVLLPCRGEW
jgi:hypothetical protein